MTTQSCDTCRYGRKFDPRLPQDLTDWGCEKPGWEGYTEPEKPACGFVFWRKKEVA